MTHASDIINAPTANQAGDLSHWTPCKPPGEITLIGRYVRLEPLNWDRHGAGLFAALCGPGDDAIWTYMPIGPFRGEAEFREIFDHEMTANDWRTMVILNIGDNLIVAMASYMRIRAAHGSVEVGCIAYANNFQRTTGATEAMALMAAHVFDDLGYRRYEWKCNDKNQASMRAAIRYGFIYEGTFRNDLVIKGANRDTAWYAIIDRDWPALARRFNGWLRPDNFDEHGTQITPLGDITPPRQTTTRR